MSVISTVNKDTYPLSGAGKVFAFASKIFDDDDLVVIRKDTAGVETVLTKTTHYTVSTGPWPTGGSITTVTNYADGTLIVKAALPRDQQYDYTILDPFPANSHEDNLDRAVLLIQELHEIISRTPALSAASAFSDLTFPEPEANKLIAWNSGGTDLENKAALDLSLTTVTAFAETLLDDANAGAARTTLSVNSTAETLALIDDLSGVSDPVTARANLGISRISFASSGGTVDAITADFAPDFAAHDYQALLMVQSSGVNTTTTPTISPDGLTAKTIVKNDNKALDIGDIPGSNFVSLLRYDSGLDKYQLLNPAQRKKVQYDYGAGTSTTLTFPAGATGCKIYADGGGGGGGGGDGSNGGGGGASGAKAIFNVLGDIGGVTIGVVCGQGGSAGATHATAAGAGGNGTASTITWPSTGGWVITAGAGEGGIGATTSPPTGKDSQQGGLGGNVAETGSQPSGLNVGQFNISSNHGQTGTYGGATGGYGARQGDTGGGGRGGATSTGGGTGTEASQGGYIHIEVF